MTKQKKLRHSEYYDLQDCFDELYAKSKLSAKINKLQSELKKITRSDDEDETIEQLEMLIEYFEGTENPINEFEESVFEFLIEKIAVINQTELEFQIIGGLKFKEKI